MTPSSPSSTAPILDPEGLARVQAALRSEGLDGWLLFEFHGQNPIAQSLTGLGWNTRRSFVLVPAEGRPVALVHAIEASSWRHWPWDSISYSGWREMEDQLAGLVSGKRLALETSPGSAVPTLDRIPGGLLDLLRSLGVDPVGSGDLVSAFHAVWTPAQLADHRRSAAVLREVVAGAFAEAAAAVVRGAPTSEGALTRWILEALASHGLGVDAGCIVAIGPRAADPHYHPEGEGETIRRGDVLLIDLWGKSDAEAVPADQTWMGILAPTVPPEVQRVWEAVREARDAALRFLQEQFEAGNEVRGFEVDDVARRHIEEAGFGPYFVHRLGHSIDRSLHGSGPNLDHLETRDTRRLIPGVGFSVEPGIYLPGVLGIRSEVNVHWGAGGPEVTGPEPQQQIFTLLDA